MVRSNVDTTRYYPEPKLVDQLREHAPLAVAALTLLFGALPITSVPWLDGMRVSAYQLPAAALLMFLSAPALMILIWVLDRWFSGFEHYTKFVLAGAAALQVVSFWFLATAASQSLTQTMAGMGVNADAIPQRLGAGFFLLLGVAVLFLIDCGLQLIKPRKKPAAPVPAQMTEQEPETVTQ